MGILGCELYRYLKVGRTPMVVQPEKIDFRRFVYNDLIDYFIVCFEHQCKTMLAF